MNYLFYLAIFVISYSLTELVRCYAVGYLMDKPNERSSHTVPTPRGGGLAIVLGVYLGLILSPEKIFLETPLWGMLGAIPVIVISWVDDHRHVPVVYRLGMQALGAIWLIRCCLWDLLTYHAHQSALIALLPGILLMVLIVWIINLYNFMDGIDALAGLEFCSLAIAVLFILLALNRIQGHEADETVHLVLLAFAATAGFLVVNWPPARIFMGDVGSNFLGYLLVVIAIKTLHQHQLGLSTWLILPAVFWLDASVTLLRRIMTDQPFYKAHRTHAYQQAARFFASHKKVSLGIALINVLYLMPLAILAEIHAHLQVIFVGLAYIPLLYLVIHFRAGLMLERDV
jgi:Fuc2NAc and GlcNAc transferase